MNKLLIIILSIVSFTFSDTWVSGYYRADGTYVQGHYRSDANDSQYDNYSSKGNTNPYTGDKGTVKTENSYYNSSSSYDDNSSGSTWVNGYTRKDGTYVNGHYRRK